MYLSRRAGGEVVRGAEIVRYCTVATARQVRFFAVSNKLLKKRALLISCIILDFFGYEQGNAKR
jgi:hypothetical protein